MSGGCWGLRAEQTWDLVCRGGPHVLLPTLTERISSLVLSMRSGSHLGVVTRLVIALPAIVRVVFALTVGRPTPGKERQCESSRCSYSHIVMPLVRTADLDWISVVGP
jgi:hypothetical protein